MSQSNHKDSQPISSSLLWSKVEKEHTKYKVNDPYNCPLLINYLDLHQLKAQSFIQSPTILTEDELEKYELVDKFNLKTSVVLKLEDDLVSNLTRALQEEQILKTKLLGYNPKYNNATKRDDFWSAWFKNSELREQIIGKLDELINYESNNSQKNDDIEKKNYHFIFELEDLKWKLQKDFRYKLATTFMPLYAKGFYEYFPSVNSILDPCSGWGDRLMGALSSDKINKYVGFDPNRSLRYGYAKLMELYDLEIKEFNTESMRFTGESNNIKKDITMYCLPFEDSERILEENSFDLVFTSPPFFDFEVYSPDNPTYEEKIEVEKKEEVEKNEEEKKVEESKWRSKPKLSDESTSIDSLPKSFSSKKLYVPKKSYNNNYNNNKNYSNNYNNNYNNNKNYNKNNYKYNTKSLEEINNTSKVWLEKFYKPLFILSCKAVKVNSYVCIYIGDTTAGKIEEFLVNEVPTFTSLKLDSKIAFLGIKSTYLRNIWVYKKY